MKNLTQAELLRTALWTLYPLEAHLAEVQDRMGRAATRHTCQGHPKKALAARLAQQGIRNDRAAVYRAIDAIETAYGNLPALADRATAALSHSALERN